MKKYALFLTAVALAADVKPADLAGKWIADDGKGTPQVFVFEARGDKISGVTCGPCDPAHVFVIEDGSVTGDKITFYIVHEDHRDMVTGTVDANEIHVQWHREMVLIGPVRLR